MRWAVALIVVGVLVAPASAAACDRYAAPGGALPAPSDSNPGTKEAPFATVQKLVDSLLPAQVGCLKRGTYPQAVEITKPNVELTSEDPLLPGRIQPPAAGLVVRAPDVTLAGLLVDVRSGTVAVRGDRDRLHGNEVVGDGSGTCLTVGASGAPVSDAVIEGNDLHRCSGPALTVTAGRSVAVLHNVIHDIGGAAGLQLGPDAQGTVVRNTIVDGAQPAIVLTGQNAAHASGTRIEGNVFSNTGTGAKVQTGWRNGSGTDNVAAGNCADGPVVAASEPGVSDGGGNALANPVDYADRGAGDYTLPPGSTCAGRGPLPAPVTGDALVGSASAATLRGTVDPHGFRARWSAELLQGGTMVRRRTTPALLPDLRLPESVEATFGDLDPDTEYAWRLVAESPAGTRVEGELRTFQTPSAPRSGLRLSDVIRPVRCVPGTTLRLLLVNPLGDSLRSVRLQVGTRARTIRGSALRRPVTLRRLPRAFWLRMTVTTASGRSINGRQRYRRCPR